MEPVASSRSGNDNRTSRPRCIGTPASHPKKALPSSQVRGLPGGGRIVEIWSSAERLTLAASGDIDSFDIHALVDVLTDGILRGARHIRIDAQHVTFCDIAALRALDRVDRFLARSGGGLTATGLRPPLDLAWALLRGIGADRVMRAVRATPPGLRAVPAGTGEAGA